MKTHTGFFVLLFLSLNHVLVAQQPQLIKIWETDSVLTTCESVVFSAAQQVLYVSNIEGTPSGKDGKGSIAKVGLDGKIITAAWVSGLNAPKGMGIYKNSLWFTDLDEIIAVDIKTATIKQRIKVPGAKFLNDLTISKSGIIYASDSDMKKVFQLKKGKILTYLDSLQRPNGLLAVDKVLYVLDSGKLLKVTKSKQVTTIAKDMIASTDGIEEVQPGTFLVSCWAGAVYSVKNDGSTQLLLDTRDEKINTADIGYDPKNRIVYIPTFYRNKVVAYELRQ